MFLGLETLGHSVTICDIPLRGLLILSSLPFKKGESHSSVVFGVSLLS